MIKKPVLILLSVLFLFVVLFPRIVETLNGNPLFEFDQGRDYLAVKDIVVNHKLTLIGAELGYGQAGLRYLFHGPMHFYLLAIPFILMNGNPVGGIYLMFLFGLLTIALGMFLASRSLGKIEAWITGFLLALCPFLITFTRSIENYYPASFFIFVVFWLVYRFTKNRSDGNALFLAAFFSAAIYNFETADAVPLCLTLFVYASIILGKGTLKRLPLLIAGFILGFAPMLMFEVRHGFLGLKFLFTYLFTQSFQTPTPHLINQANSFLNLTSYSISNSFAWAPSLSGWSTILIIFLFALLIYTDKNSVRRRLFFYFLLLYPVNFLVFLPLRNILYGQYIVDLYLVNIIAVAYVFTRLYRSKYRVGSYLVVALVAVQVITGTVKAYTISAHDMSDYGGPYKLIGKIEALDFIYRDAGNKPFNVLVFYPPVYTYPYDYLLWWHSLKKYGYLPGHEKTGTFYLLMQVDPGKPWTYIGWKDTVVKTGKVIFTKTLPQSGIIIEKRVAE